MIVAEQISSYLADQIIALGYAIIYKAVLQKKTRRRVPLAQFAAVSQRYNKRAGNAAGHDVIPCRKDILERSAGLARKIMFRVWEGDTVVSSGSKGEF